MSKQSEAQIGSEFVHTYFSTLLKKPADVVHLYGKDSKLVLACGTEKGKKFVGIKEIEESIGEQPYKYVTVKIDLVDEMETAQKALVVTTRGTIVNGKNQVVPFIQTVVLEPQQNGGYYIFQELLRFDKVVEKETEEVSQGNGEKPRASAEEEGRKRLAATISEAGDAISDVDSTAATVGTAFSVGVQEDLLSDVDMQATPLANGSMAQELDSDMSSISEEQVDVNSPTLDKEEEETKPTNKQQHEAASPDQQQHANHKKKNKRKKRNNNNKKQDKNTPQNTQQKTQNKRSKPESPQLSKNNSDTSKNNNKKRQNKQKQNQQKQVKQTKSESKKSNNKKKNSTYADIVGTDKVKVEEPTIVAPPTTATKNTKTTSPNDNKPKNKDKKKRAANGADAKGFRPASKRHQNKRRFNLNLQVYVRGVSSTTNKPDLKKTFMEFGTVQDIYIKNRDVKVPYAYVTYSNVEHAKAAVEAGSIKYGKDTLIITQRDQPNSR